MTDFTDQARQLVQEELSPHELPDGQIVINRLIAAFASALAEAATQGRRDAYNPERIKPLLDDAHKVGQIVGVERAAEFLEKQTSAHVTIVEEVRALSPDPSYLDRVAELKRELAELREINQGIIDGIADGKALIESQHQAELDRVRNEAASVVVNGLAQDVLEVCKTRGWSLRWTHRGAYLHLESSELIEAIRGKHGDPLKEAADVLLVLMSITENQGIPFDAVLERARLTANELKSKPHYAGEEYDDRSR